jgi:hypothetical protein
MRRRAYLVRSQEPMIVTLILQLHCNASIAQHAARERLLAQRKASWQKFTICQTRQRTMFHQSCTVPSPI